MAALRLAVAAWVVLACAACTSVERTERPLKVIIETAPRGASVGIARPGREPLPLGKAPVSIGGLALVRKRYLSGAVDYWLYDGAKVLPENPVKPSYASPAYLAGNDYPLDLTIVAWTEAKNGAAGSARLHVDESVLRALYLDADPVLRVRVGVPEPPPAKPPSMPH